jgi:uncharacterized protein GlcG (DUF336 family)
VVIGAVGASGGSVKQDVEVAEAAVAGFDAMTNSGRVAAA